MKREEKKLVKNTLLLMLGNFSSKLLVFLMVPLYTSVLTTAEYATSDLLTTTINLLYPFATLMISTAVMRFCLDKLHLWHWGRCSFSIRVIYKDIDTIS